MGALAFLARQNTMQMVAGINTLRKTPQARNALVCACVSSLVVSGQGWPSGECIDHQFESGRWQGGVRVVGRPSLFSCPNVLILFF